MRIIDVITNIMGIKLIPDDKVSLVKRVNILNNSIVGQSISKYINDIKEKKKKEFLLIENKLLDKEKDIIKIREDV